MFKSNILWYTIRICSCRSQKVLTLASTLTPCYWRLGGTDADFLIFGDETDKRSLNFSTVQKLPQSTGGFNLERAGNNDVAKIDLQNNAYSSPLNVSGDTAINRIQLLDRSRRDVGIDKDYTNFTMSGEKLVHQIIFNPGNDFKWVC